MRTADRKGDLWGIRVPPFHSVRMSSDNRIDQDPTRAPARQLALFLFGVIGALAGFLVSWCVVPHGDPYLGAYPIPLILPLLVLGSGAGCLIAAFITRFLQWLMPGNRHASVPIVFWQ